MIEKSEYIEDDTLNQKEIVDETESTLIDDIVGKEYTDIFIPN